jgi:mannitol 2-dehydrogenase
MSMNSVGSHSPIKLNQSALSSLSNHARIPQYNRQKITSGIFHIGVGGFHRAHQALYLDNYFEQNPASDWGITGVGLLEQDQRMRDALQSQDCLYTLVERSAAGDAARVIGSIQHYLYAPSDRQTVIDALAAPDCRIVTLTVTEGGYYYIEGSGEFDVNHPTIQHDLQHPEQPIGTYGFLTAALDQRRKQGMTPFTVLSCDNLQGNGNITQKMLLAFAELRDPTLANWIGEHVSFPNCMVDRITPATTAADIQMVRDQYGIEDAFPVVAEPFLQWVIEDRFSAGRPKLESVGVEFTSDVHPYEMMKIRLLNASHLLMGYLGTLAGYNYAHETMNDPQLRQVVMHLMEEVTPTLQPIPGVDFNSYKQTLIERFSNPKIRDQLPRLCLNGSAKMPKWVLNTIRDCLRQNRSIDYLSLTVAAWFRYLAGHDDQGNPIQIDDPMAEVLMQRVSGADPKPLLSLQELFGELATAPRFVEAVTQQLDQLYRLGAKQTIAKAASN